MEHKTIICEPNLFDNEFYKWKESVEKKDNDTVVKLSSIMIQHMDEGIHYILFKTETFYRHFECEP